MAVAQVQHLQALHLADRPQGIIPHTAAALQVQPAEKQHITNSNLLKNLSLGLAQG